MGETDAGKGRRCRGAGLAPIHYEFWRVTHLVQIFVFAFSSVPLKPPFPPLLGSDPWPFLPLSMRSQRRYRAKNCEKDDTRQRELGSAGKEQDE
jgi:hypothetical protein